MSIRYQADNDLNQRIVAATYRKQPGIVETLILIWADNQPENWRNAITVIPF